MEQVQDQVIFMPKPVLEPLVKLSDEGELLLRRVVGAMRKDLEHWNQRHWVSKNDCGTQGCLAGWIVVIGEGRSLEDLYDGVCHRNESTDFPGTALKLLGLTEYNLFRDLFGATSDTEVDEPGAEHQGLEYRGDRSTPRKRFKLFLAQVTEMTGIDF